MKKSKTPSESAVEPRYILAPHQVNTLGTDYDLTATSDFSGTWAANWPLASEFFMAAA